jgi:hypothetical protein
MNSANTFLSDYSLKTTQKGKTLPVEFASPDQEIVLTQRTETQDSEDSNLTTDRFFDRSFLGFWRIR